MTGAVAPDSAATAPQERGWRWFVIALALMVAVTAAPRWTPALALLGGTIRLLLPIEQFALLVLVAIRARLSKLSLNTGSTATSTSNWSTLAAKLLLRHSSCR